MTNCPRKGRKHNPLSARILTNCGPNCPEPPPIVVGGGAVKAKRRPGPLIGGPGIQTGGVDGKPDSVGGRSRVQPFLWAGRCRPARARDPFQNPRTRAPDESGWNCLRLHAVGFAVPFPSPGRRCALTAPFHPCHARPKAPFGGLLSVALSRRRARAPGWPLATTVSNRVRTFLRGPDGPRRLHVHAPERTRRRRKSDAADRDERPAARDFMGLRS